MRVQVLGPLTVTIEGEELALGGRQQRLALALLIVAGGRTVSTDQLIDGVWGEEVTATARKALQGYIHHLRSEIGEGLKTESGGYSLEMRDEIDATRFGRLHHEARELLEIDPARASELLSEALGMWNGPAYSDLRDEMALIPEVVRLDNLRVAALGDRIDADLALGRHETLIGELEGLTYEYPFQERFRGQHMTALYRASRQVEALRSYERLRRFLADETGLEPSEELQQLEQRILSRDESLLIAESDALAATTAIRGYELRELVSSDGGSETYRAYQRSIGREVGLRVLGPEIADEPSFIATFLADTGRVAAMEHPHLAFVFDTWREPGRAYQVSRWFGGGSLADALESGQLDPNSALRTLDEAGGALAHAHRQGVTHGRVTPSAVLFDDSGHAYLGDFVVGVPNAGASPARDRLDFAALAHTVIASRPPQMVNGSMVADFSGTAVPAGVESVFDLAFGQDGYRRVDDFLRALRQAAGVDVVAIPTGAPQRSETRNPYKGLQAFQESDSDDFFGRDALVRELLDRLDESRLLAVIGPSGSGKSSVVKAGLMSRLRAASDGGLLISELYPGAFPFEELEGALLRVGINRTGVMDDLLGDDRGLLRVLKQILPSDDAELVLVIDQFEELFSTVTDEDARQLFLSSLVTATTDPRSRIRVVLTMRADFFDRPLEYPRFGELLKEGLVAVTMPSEAELALAIAQPARSVGVEFEPGLVSQIVSDVTDQPGGLPLLQYALTELFEDRDADVLTFDAYRRSGGVLGALGRRAEQLYRGLGAPAQQAAQQAFLRMVTVLEGADDLRRRVRRSELSAPGVDERDLNEALQAFGAHRLMTFDRDPITRGPTVEVAHEALLREWDTLGNWVDEQREELVIRKRLGFALSEWQQSGDDDSYLPRGGRLAQFQEWASTTTLTLTTEERAFLLAGAEAEADEAGIIATRRRRLTAGLGVAALLMALIAVFGFVQSNRADEQADIARHESLLNRSRALAGAVTAAQDQDSDRALLLALAAADTTLSTGAGILPEAFQALHQAIGGHRIQLRIAEGGGSHVAWSPDGTVLLTAPAPGVAEEATLRRVDDGGVLATLGGSSPVTGAAWSEDGSTVATTHESGEITIWDPVAATERGVLEGGEAPAMPVVDATGRLLAVVESEEILAGDGFPDVEMSVRVWDLTDMTERWLISPDDYVDATSISPDGSLLAVGEADNHAFSLWDMTTGRVVATLDVEDYPEGAVFDPSGDLLATLDQDSITIWDVATLEPLRSWPSPKWSETIAWSTDGSMIASAGNSDIVEVYDVSTGGIVFELVGHPEEPLSMAFHLDAGGGMPRVRLASTDESGVTFVWELNTRTESVAVRSMKSGDFNYAQYIEDDGLVLIGDGDYTELTADVEWPHPNVSVNGTPTDRFGYHIHTDPRGSIAIAPTRGGDTIVFDPSTMDPIRTFSTKWDVGAISSDGSLALVAPFQSAPALLIDLESGEEVTSLRDPMDPIDELFGGSFSPDGSLVAFGSYREGVRVYDIGAEQHILRLELADDESATTGTITFNGDGTLLAIGDSSGTVRVISVADLIAGGPESEWLVAEFRALDGTLIHVAFTPDQSMLAVSGVADVIEFWSTADWTKAFTLPTGGVTNTFDISSDGAEVVAAVQELALLFIPISPDSLVELAVQTVTRGFTEDECIAFTIEPCPTTLDAVAEVYGG